MHPALVGRSTPDFHRVRRPATARGLRVALLGVATLASTGLAGCASFNTNKERGAAIGAATGAAAGVLVGRSNGSTARGAIIGAAVGGAAGAIIGHQMDQRAKELEQTIAGARVERVGEGILVTFDSGILFDYASEALREPARANLRELARNFGKYPDSELLIVGHTDARGEDAYNRALSERRAASAASFLADQGVPRARIRTAGKGEAEPVAQNETDDGRQQNRRVEVAITASEAARARARQQTG